MVEPGTPASVEIVVRNTGTVVDEFRFEVLGDGFLGASVEPPALSLFPGTEGVATVWFRPPRSSEVSPGPAAFGIRVASKEDPAGSVVEEGTAEIGRFSDLAAELVPRTDRGRLRSRHNMAVDNRGNGVADMDLMALDPNELLRFDVKPTTLGVPPGTAGFARVSVRPKKKFLTGPPQTKGFQLSLLPKQDPPIVLDGSLVQEALIPKWLPKALAALAALALLWVFLLKPQIDSIAEDAARDATATPLAAHQDSLDNLNGRVKALEEKPPSGTGGGTSTASESTVNERFDRRFEVTAAGGSPAPRGRTAETRTPFTVPSGQTLFLTDLILQNAQPDLGSLQVRRGGSVLLQVRLENFRDLDYHFVEPIRFRAGSGERLTVTLVCENPDANNPCSAAVYTVGFLERRVTRST